MCPRISIQEQVSLIVEEKPLQTDDGIQGNLNNGEVWHAIEANDVVRALKTSPKNGLASAEAAWRFGEVGPNELAEQPRRSYRRWWEIT
jgi:hypothetical protein